MSLEAILQANEKYKFLSLYNFLFFSLSLSLPSLSFLYNSEATLDNLLLISTYLKVFTISAMLILIILNNLIKISDSDILINNLKKNSKWLTLNNIVLLDQVLYCQPCSVGDSCHISGGSHTLVLHPGESIPGGHMLGGHTPGSQLPKW